MHDYDQSPYLMIDGWAPYRWTMSNRVARLDNMEKRVVGNSKKG